MSSSAQLINKIERLLLDEFCESPFHNLYYLGYCKPEESGWGGTCSDKVLLFKNKLASYGIKASLHCALINGQEMHRLLALDIEGVIYFADVGNGWPSIRLFSSQFETSYTAFGITYKSRLRGDFLEVYQIKAGKQSLSVVIPLKLQDERQVYDAIEARFDGTTRYPFDNSVRFSQVVGDSFIFLKGRLLRIYNEDKPVQIIELSSEGRLLEVIEVFFNADLKRLGTCVGQPCIGQVRGVHE